MNSNSNEFANDVDPILARRAALAERFPSWTQGIITWLMGLALPGQKPVFEWNAAAHIVLTYLALLGGPVLSAALIESWPLGLPLSWLLTVYGARKAQVQISHQAIHQRLTGIAWLDRLFAELNSILLFIQSPEQYYEEHVRSHHSSAIASAVDPDAAFLIRLGFRPGTPVSRLQMRLGLSIFSPRFHAIFMAARLRSCFGSGTWLRRVLAGLLWVLTSAAISRFDLWWEILVAWLFPMTVLYHVSALLQLATEHLWLRRRTEAESARDHLNGVLIIRLLGDAPVPRGLPAGRALFAWVRWTLRLFLVHLPVRLCVLVADLPAHGWHHLHPRSREWPNAIYALSAEVYAHRAEGQPYLMVLGFGAAVRLVLGGISAGTLEHVGRETPGKRGNRV